jgi:FolB domain-containing protein
MNYDLVLIHDLVARGVIGISDLERSKPQEIVMNITLYADTRRGADSDQIDDCVNYRTVAKKCLAHAESAARYTVEALAQDLAKICLAEKGVFGAKIRVEKPGAVRFARSVGVEIERFNEGE